MNRERCGAYRTALIPAEACPCLTPCTQLQVSSISGSDTETDDEASHTRAVQKSAQLIFKSSGVFAPVLAHASMALALSALNSRVQVSVYTVSACSELGQDTPSGYLASAGIPVNYYH